MTDTGASARVIGRYLLGGELAAGGMATVHIGRLDAELGFSRVVAIKQLHPQYARDPDFVSMLLDEARLACRIRHAHVVPVLDVVIDESELFLVMDYVAGESLASLLRSASARGERVPVGVAVALAVGILEGLQAAHEARDEHGEPLCIVHRDVSPQNVLVGVDGLSRLLDFGIAKAVGRSQTTRNNELKGKLAYMAPEQLARAEVDARADVFAASIVLWEMLTGRRLFATDDEVSTCARVATLAIPRAGALVAVPAALDDVLMQGLSRAVDERWPSARAMSRGLEELGLSASASEVATWLGKLDTPMLTRASQLIEACAPGRARRSQAPGALTHDHPLVRIVKRAEAAEAPTRIVTPTAPQVAQAPLAQPARGPWRARVALTGLLLTLLVGVAALTAQNEVRPRAPLSTAALPPPSPARALEATRAPAVGGAPILVTASLPAERVRELSPRTRVQSRSERPRSQERRRAVRSEPPG